MKKDNTYYVYELIGKRKIGCTTNVRTRARQQGQKNNFKVLAENKCIYIASFLERFLQELNGYKVDRHPYYLTYANSVRRSRKGNASQAKNGTGLFDPTVHKERVRKQREEKSGRFDPALQRRNVELASIACRKNGKAIFNKANQIKMHEASMKTQKERKSGLFGTEVRAIANNTKYRCPDGHISSMAWYKKYCLNRGLDPSAAVKITA